jgi:hypothetical protein
MSTDKQCSGASPGAPANSLQLWRGGRYLPFTCIQAGLCEYIERVHDIVSGWTIRRQMVGLMKWKGF